VVPPNKNSSKSRLLDKLKKKAQADDVEEADDVMGDVTFTNRRGGGGGMGGTGGAASARKELLESLGDGVAVSDEGVLGGANDALFGGRQRFASYQPGGSSSASHRKDGSASAAGGEAQEERGADGAAMSDDFYQRDVQAEYEELDYDANEQFDDDDVDVGETEVVEDGEDYEPDEDDEDDGDREEAISGAEGLASVAGFKMMLAKARGEVQQEKLAVESTEGTADAAGKKTDEQRQDEDGDHMAKIMAAAEKSAQAAKEKVSAVVDKKPAVSAIQVDENGLRIITLDAVRNEIWLNHGSIPVKRLMKIFDVKKKSSAERQDKFREVIKELCAMKTDAVGGKILVLKQHYANMG
jgi:hypothetical protein